MNTSVAGFLLGVSSVALSIYFVVLAFAWGASTGGLLTVAFLGVGLTAILGCVDPGDGAARFRSSFNAPSVKSTEGESAERSSRLTPIEPSDRTATRS